MPTTRSCRTEYEQYTRGALMQLRRVREGSQLEEDHMRNRQLIVNWLRRHTDAIEVRRREGKTYFTMVDAGAFHAGVGTLLAEVQRIKSEGDYEAARQLIEDYGVHFDPSLRDEVVVRVDRAAAAVVLRVRDAPPRTPARAGRQHRRRRRVLSLRPRGADAGVLRAHPRLTRA